MEEKKHVGRPTNEEVAKRNRKKIIKISLITLVCILLFGGVFIFLNRDNIDFSSIMGNSATKTYNYRDEYGMGSFSLDRDELGFSKFKKCTVSNKKIISCLVFNNSTLLSFEAKKSGVVKVKVEGKDLNGKNVKKTIKIKVPKDFKSPICKLSLNSKSVKRGSTINALVTCNEKIKYNEKYFILSYDKKDKNGYIGIVNDFVNSVKRKSDNSFSINFTIPKDAPISNNIVFEVYEQVFKDYSNNKTTRLKATIKVTK